MSLPEAVRRLESWVEAYVRAWASNEPDDIRGLFTEDARYFTAPDRAPWEGRDEIAAGWLGRKDEPGAWTFRSEVMLASEEGMNLVRGWTDYPSEGKRYSNLWVIHLDDEGRCSEFVEWWMERDDDDG